MVFGTCILENTTENYEREISFYLKWVYNSLKSVCKFLRFAKMQVHSIKGYKKGTGNFNPFPNEYRLFKTESLQTTISDLVKISECSQKA